MKYDPHNIFARLLRGDLPYHKITEGTHYLAFHDIQPKAPIHALVIPKGPYQNASVFHQSAPPPEIIDFYQGVMETINLLDLQNGYRLISNTGAYANQEVPHFHIHILGGKPLGPLLALETSPYAG